MHAAARRALGGAARAGCSELRVGSSFAVSSIQLLQQPASVVGPACGEALAAASVPLGFLGQGIISRGFAAQAEPLKTYKPVTPGQRHRITTSRVDLWKGRPVKALTEGLRKTGGRNNFGHITTYQRGGGHKRLYRYVDFLRNRVEEQGTVERFEYDPNRSARIALLNYADSAKGKYAYILAPEGLKVGDSVACGEQAGIFPGNTLPLQAIPVGTTVHNIELRAGGGGQLARSAGAAATLLAKQENGYALLRMPSGEQRLVRLECSATVGAVGNKDHKNRKIGKAGIARHLGRRPHVRGVAMNPIDHPHGGGEGKTSGGRPSCSPWGIPTKGYKTRNNPRTDKLIVSRRR